MSRKKKTEHTMDVILIIIGIFLAVFTAVMIAVFCLYQSTPDTLIGCVFAATASEAGIMGWIKNTKERQETRRWEIEDRKFNTIQANLERMVDSNG